MNCDTLQNQLTAWLDGELLPEMALELEQHLAACSECTLARADLAAVRVMASAWTVDAPELNDCVMKSIVADDQRLLLDEIRHLRAEMQDLRAEVAALRRQFPRRVETPQWTPPARPDYSKMENDPWISTRS